MTTDHFLSLLEWQSYTSFPRPPADWESVIWFQEEKFLFDSFGYIALSARTQVKLWCRIKSAFLTGDFRMNFQTTFLGRYITNIISAHARTTLSEASIHKKRWKWCSQTHTRWERKPLEMFRVFYSSSKNYFLRTT